MKRTFFLLLLFLVLLPASAQIGYQVSLLNTATGKPRANVTVNADIAITNAEGGLVYSTTQRATTNDFGVLALTVGNADTFSKVDWSKLPLYISVSVDGTLVGKSQILSVPVAEYAKKADNVLTKEMIVGKWVHTITRMEDIYGEDDNGQWTVIGEEPKTYSFYLQFNEDGSIGIGGEYAYVVYGTWFIHNNMVVVCDYENTEGSNSYRVIASNVDFIHHIYKMYYNAEKNLLFGDDLLPEPFYGPYRRE